MWLDVAITLSCAGGGLICGWVMHAFSGLDHERWSDDFELGREDNCGLTGRQVSQTAKQLQEFAAVMAADVDAHQHRVQEVNDNLIQGGAETSPDDVYAAVGQLIESNEQMQTQLQLAQDRIQEQTMQIESAERRAETDALTQIPNRRAFDNHLLKRHELGAGEAGSLALLDVDHFKKFNDMYGHRAGDEVLRVVAKVLHSHLHSHGLVARFGGEEFALILNACPIEEATILIERARVAIGQRVIEFEGERLKVKASAGVADLMEGETSASWLQRADEALYRSKEAGRDCAHRMEGSTPILIGPSDGETESNDTHGEVSVSAKLESSDPIEVDGAGDNPKVSNVFASLPVREDLEKSFDEIRDRTKESVSMHVMVLALPPDLEGASARSLLQIVRAPLRSVDRLGLIGDSTLLICMPSTDEGITRRLGEQICHSAVSIGIVSDSDESSPITVGIVEAKPSEDFDQVVSRAMEEVREQQNVATTSE